jgi:hypothetical protein
LLLHAVESGVKGAFFDVEEFGAGLLDERGDAVAVAGGLGEGLEDEEGEGALESVSFGFRHT